MLDDHTRIGYNRTQNGYKEQVMVKALFPSTKRKVLTLFFSNPGREYYFAEVVRLTGTKQGAVQRELQTMTDAGIINCERRGRQKFYSVNESNPIFVDLRNIVFKTCGVAGQLRDALQSLKSRIKVAFVYGSFATGKETAKSDIDVFVIGNVSLEEVVSALSRTENSLGREINPTVSTEREFKDRHSKGNHFVRSLMASKLEFLIGSFDDLRALAAK